LFVTESNRARYHFYFEVSKPLSVIND
jgi:hypothetical protein